MKLLLVGVCLLAALLPESEAMNGAAVSRGQRKGWDPVFRVPYNLGGPVCRKKKKDTMACSAAQWYLSRHYGVTFNQAHCAKKWFDGKHKLRCHLKYKPSATTDFECWVWNEGGAAMARCRAPWGKPLVENQRMTNYAGMGPPNNPYGMGMSQPGMGMSGGMMSGMGMQGGMGGMYGGSMPGMYGGYGGYGG